MCDTARAMNCIVPRFYWHTCDTAQAIISNDDNDDVDNDVNNDDVDDDILPAQM